MSSVSEKKDQLRIAEIDRLYSEVQEYRSSKNFSELIEFVAKFRNLAPFNAMLVHMQKPGSTFVASAGDWAVKFNRCPKAGVRPLVILRQFGPVSFVFEYEDTEGDPLPEQLVKPFKTNEVVSEEQLKTFTESMVKEGISYSEVNYGTDQAGQISQKTKKEMAVVGNELISLRYDMVVNKNLNSTERTATALHELAHLYCGHLGRSIDEKWLPERPALDLNSREFEAETVCWLICERLGIVNPSKEYLAMYLKDNHEIPKEISINIILKASDAIEKIFKGENRIRTELIVKADNHQQYRYR